MIDKRDFDNIVWLKKNHINPPKYIKNWIFDKNSLTQKLQNLYPKFRVQLLSEIIEDEFIKREVYLCNNDIPLVYAVSFIPAKCKKLQNLGNQPLGEILFKNANRNDILITNYNNIWGRESFFNFEGFEIIVCEFFLETIYS